MPTGTVVECQDERSQYKNKDRAMKHPALPALLDGPSRSSEQRTDLPSAAARWAAAMRNERIRTYNFPQGRVTDHRIGLTLYQIDAVHGRRAG